MNAQEAINFADQLFFQQTGKHLNTPQTMIIRELWSNTKLTYDDIALNNYTPEYIKGEGQKLWAGLSEALKEKVTKATFKVVFERRWTTPPLLPPPINDPHFVGREGAIADLNLLIHRGQTLILIHNAGGTGKTTLAKKYLTKKYGDRLLIFQLAKETQNFGSVESLIEEKLRQLGEEPGRDFNVSLERLKSKLQTQEMGVLIDNIEPGLDGHGLFIEPHRNYVELLRIFNDEKIKGITLITSREELHKPSINIWNYKLEGLNLEAWQEYFNYKQVNTNTENNYLLEIHKAFGGNAKAMDVICQAIITDFEGDLEQYWLKNQENLLLDSTLENLIKEQFERLQKINLDAYNLLCRMGCYRYQDVPTVPELGLISLLWDVSDKKQHQKIIKVLKERGLVEFNKGEYWLHPVIREEAIERLRNSADWETANTKAAEFWTESVKEVNTVKDALTAFEAYHHYNDIEDYEGIGNILFQYKRKSISEWEHITRCGINLFDDCRRLGLLSKLQIIRKVENPITNKNAYFYFAFACLDWYDGKIKLAIDKFETGLIEIEQKTESDSEKTPKSQDYDHLLDLRYGTYASIGYCYLNLRKIELAKEKFNELLTFCDSEKNQFTFNFQIECYMSLALIESLQDQPDMDKINNWLEKIFAQNIDQNKDINLYCSAYRLLFAGLTYRNIEETGKAQEKVKEILLYYESKNYNYFYKEVVGLAYTLKAELYRIQNDFKTALDHHQESIEILDKIGAKCDLAEAYFQLALTYKKMGDKTNSETYFNKALNLWGKEQIDAPKQIERVLKAMNLSSDQL